MVVRAKVGCDGKGGVKGGEEEGEGEEEGCHVFLFAELDRWNRTRSWMRCEMISIINKKSLFLCCCDQKQKMDLQNYF